MIGSGGAPVGSGGSVGSSVASALERKAKQWGEKLKSGCRRRRLLVIRDEGEVDTLMDDRVEFSLCWQAGQIRLMLIHILTSSFCC